MDDLMQLPLFEHAIVIIKAYKTNHKSRHRPYIGFGHKVAAHILGGHGMRAVIIDSYRIMFLEDVSAILQLPLDVNPCRNSILFINL